MDRALAEQLLPWVNDKAFREVVEAYADARIDELQGALERGHEMLDIARAQGAVMELRRIFKLRDTVLAFENR